MEPCSCRYTKKVKEDMGGKKVERIIRGCGRPAVKRCRHGFATCERCNHGCKNEQELSLSVHNANQGGKDVS